jgi:hypothetical protein
MVNKINQPANARYYCNANVFTIVAMQDILTLQVGFNIFG